MEGVGPVGRRGLWEGGVGGGACGRQVIGVYTLPWRGCVFQLLLLWAYQGEHLSSTTSLQVDVLPWSQLMLD